MAAASFITPTRVDNDTFTVPTDLKAIYHTGRRLKVTESATGYCTIASSSFGGGVTTVNVTMDSGNLPATLSAVYVSALSASNDAIPHGLAAYPRLATTNTFTGSNTFTPDAKVERSESGGAVDLRASNTSNTASSNARLTTRVGGSSAGDCVINYEIAGVQQFTSGIDNSDSDIWKLQAGASLNSTDGLSMTTGNVVRYAGLELGFRQGNTVAFGGNHTLLDANRGKLHQYNGGGGHTLTIDPSATSTGLSLVICNAQLNVTISSGTLFWFTGGGGLSTGARSVAAGGFFTVHIDGAGNAHIWGAGIS